MSAPTRIADSHFHLFDRREVPQAGLLAAAAVQRDFLWSDYEAAWQGLPLTRAVMVQVRDEADGLAEAALISSVAGVEPRLAGMVAGNLVEQAERREELDGLRRFSLVRGVRRGTQFHPDPLYLAETAMVEGFRRVADIGLVPEVCVKHFQLDGVIALASHLPQTTIVLDHLGKPDMIEGDQPGWRERMSELAQHPNVVVKLSVVVQQPDDPPLVAAAVGPLVNQVVQMFGWDRVMYGSNWPVCLIVTNLREWIRLLLDAFPNASDDELDRLFYRNAARVWQLE